MNSPDSHLPGGTAVPPAPVRASPTEHTDAVLAPEASKPEVRTTKPAAMPPPAPTAAEATVEALAADPVLDAIAALTTLVEGNSSTLGELRRLRAHDTELADRMHAEIGRLRKGEFVGATNPLVLALLRLSDTMSAMAAGDASSDAAMLRSQLLQALEVAMAVTSYEPNIGDVFNAAEATGAGRAVATSAEQDGTVSRCVKPGFRRADGSVVRAAEVEVFRYTKPVDNTPAPVTGLSGADETSSGGGSVPSAE